MWGGAGLQLLPPTKPPGQQEPILEVRKLMPGRPTSPFNTILLLRESEPSCLFRDQVTDQR